MWGRGPIGSIGTCSTLCLFSVTPSATHNQIRPHWCCFPSEWVCVRSGTLWVSPKNSPVRLGVSPTAASTPTGVFNQRFEALFPCARALGYAVCHPVAAIPLSPAARLHPSYRSGRMFLLYLLGCWTSIQFDFLLVLVVLCFYIVVVLLLVVQGGAMCLPMPPSWPLEHVF